MVFSLSAWHYNLGVRFRAWTGIPGVVTRLALVFSPKSVGEGVKSFFCLYFSTGELSGGFVDFAHEFLPGAAAIGQFLPLSLPFLVEFCCASIFVWISLLIDDIALGSGNSD
ncbi:hypothetical protein L2E82_43951 [Cichorium intybus]|uniref:Uncharacterized protein n=1 Tax=Cichorium intybus TaxID=13427 RepID=A0ACB8ZNK0_CICIN|nr:hypothetical protein L2E82_43951 [Cichorium intybus]